MSSWDNIIINLKKGSEELHQEAIDDGIRFVRRKSISDPTYYYPKCCVCGAEVMSHSYIRKNKYTCKACKLNKYLSDKGNREVVSWELKEKKLQNAIKRISAKTKSIQKYDKAIEVVKKHLHKDGWFDSTEEIMVALELLKNNIVVRHQVKYGRYKADFVLPNEKVVLEVDGTLYHTKGTLQKEVLRDNLIVLSLGVDWEVIRITDEMLNENITKLLSAIRKIVQKRKSLRSKESGVLPEWYTNRKI